MATIKSRLEALEGATGGDDGSVTAIKFSVYDARSDGDGVRAADGYRITLRSTDVERVEHLPDESRDTFESRVSAALDRHSKPNGVPPIAWPLFDEKPQQPLQVVVQ